MFGIIGPLVGLGSLLDHAEPWFTDRFSAYYVPKIVIFYLLWAKGGSLWVYEQVWRRVLSLGARAVEKVPQSPQDIPLMVIREETHSESLTITVKEEQPSASWEEETRPQTKNVSDNDADDDAGEEDEDEETEQEDEAIVNLTAFAAAAIHDRKTTLVSQFKVDGPPLFLASTELDEEEEESSLFQVPAAAD
jgi:hypothetical protein